MLADMMSPPQHIKALATLMLQQFQSNSHNQWYYISETNSHSTDSQDDSIVMLKTKNYFSDAVCVFDWVSNVFTSLSKT